MLLEVDVALVLSEEPVELAAGICSWDLFVRVISYMGVVWGVGIQVFAGSNFSDFSISTKVIIFLAVVQIVLYLKE